MRALGQLDLPPRHLGICWPRSPASRTDRLLRLMRGLLLPSRRYPVRLGQPDRADATWLWRPVAGPGRAPQESVGTDCVRQLLPAQARSASPRAGNQPDLLGTHLVSARTQEITQRVDFRRHRWSPLPASTRCHGPRCSLSRPLVRGPGTGRYCASSVLRSLPFLPPARPMH